MELLEGEAITTEQEEAGLETLAPQSRSPPEHRGLRAGAEVPVRSVVVSQLTSSPTRPSISCPSLSPAQALNTAKSFIDAASKADIPRDGHIKKHALLNYGAIMGALLDSGTIDSQAQLPLAAPSVAYNLATPSSFINHWPFYGVTGPRMLYYFVTGTVLDNSTKEVAVSQATTQLASFIFAQQLLSPVQTLGHCAPCYHAPAHGRTNLGPVQNTLHYNLTDCAPNAHIPPFKKNQQLPVPRKELRSHVIMKHTTINDPGPNIVIIGQLDARKDTAKYTNQLPPSLKFDLANRTVLIAGNIVEAVSNAMDTVKAIHNAVDTVQAVGIDVDNFLGSQFSPSTLQASPSSPLSSSRTPQVFMTSSTPQDYTQVRSLGRLSVNSVTNPAPALLNRWWVTGLLLLLVCQESPFGHRRPRHWLKTPCPGLPRGGGI